jgi:GTPase SAR1 family protein
MQNVAIVETIVKCHSNQKKIDLFIAENASKITNQNQEVGAVDLVVDQAVDLVEIEVLDLVDETTDHEKCLMQNAEIVETIVKYHSNQKKIDLFIAENASKIIDNTSELFFKETQTRFY